MSAETARAVEVDAVMLDRLIGAATGRYEHTYIDGHLGRRHSLACAICDAVAEAKKALAAEAPVV